MSVAGVFAAPPADSPDGISSHVARPQTLAEPGFARMFAHGLETVNRQLIDSQGDLQALAMGEPENLHQIMIRLEEARLSFDLALQIRSRLLEAYQDIMRMQV